MFREHRYDTHAVDRPILLHTSVLGSLCRPSFYELFSILCTHLARETFMYSTGSVMVQKQQRYISIAAALQFKRGVT